MTLVLHYHPLSSFCWKVLIPLYERELPFERVLVDFGDPASRAAFEKLWPMAKMPVLEDKENGDVVAESSIIIEYLEDRFGPKLIPVRPSEARQVRFLDRFFDNYVHAPMQRIIADRIRPEGSRDPYGVDESRALLAKGCAMVDGWMADRHWAEGGTFSLADCAAAPALFYANEVMPLGEHFPNALAYLSRLKERPSVARTIGEAGPYLHMFPRG
jgi:glutathione S-transferase